MKRHVTANGRMIGYELVQTDRRDLSVKVSKSDVRLFAPRRAKLRLCDAFVAEQAEWIADTQKQLLEYDRRYVSEHPLENGARLMLVGNLIPLDIKRAERAQVWESGGALVVRTPETDRESVRAAIVDYLTARARVAVDESVKRYAPIVGRIPKSVRLREQKTRWGSCSSEGNINLNWKLIMAPKQSLDYVVAHELCHLYELNHSAMFWKRVKSVMPDYEYWKKWLKDNAAALGV